MSPIVSINLVPLLIIEFMVASEFYDPNFENNSSISF